MDDGLFRLVNRAGVKLSRCWVPAHSRYFDFVGIVDKETSDALRVQVYGYREMGGDDQLVLKRKANPIDASLDLGDRKEELRWASMHEEPEPDMGQW